MNEYYFVSRVNYTVDHDYYNLRNEPVGQNFDSIIVPRPEYQEAEEGCLSRLYGKVIPLFDNKIGSSICVIFNETSQIISDKSNKTAKATKSILGLYKSTVSLLKKIKGKDKKEKVKEPKETEETEENKAEKKEKKVKPPKSLFSTIYSFADDKVSLLADMTDFAVDAIEVLNENDLVKMGYIACGLDKDFSPISKTVSVAVEAFDSWVSSISDTFKFVNAFKKWWKIDPKEPIKAEKLYKRRMDCLETALDVSSVALGCLSYLSKTFSYYHPQMENFEGMAKKWIKPAKTIVSIAQEIPNIKKWWTTDLYTRYSMKEKDWKEIQMDCLEAAISIGSLGMELIDYLPQAKEFARPLGIVTSVFEIFSASVGIYRILSKS